MQWGNSEFSLSGIKLQLAVLCPRKKNGPFEREWKSKWKIHMSVCIFIYRKTKVYLRFIFAKGDLFHKWNFEWDCILIWMREMVW